LLKKISASQEVILSMDVVKLSKLSHFLWKHQTYSVSGFYVNYEV